MNTQESRQERVSDDMRRRVLLVAAGAIFLAVGLVFTWVLLDTRREVTRAVAVAASNVATTVAQDVDRNIELMDLSLQAVTDAWTRPELRTLTPMIRRMVLFDRAASASGFGDVAVLDRNGVVQESSRNPLLVGASLADREYFQAHANTDGVGLYVSKPFVGRINGIWQIGLSRRYNDADGQFAGIVVGTISLDYLNQLYRAVDLGQGGSVTLLRTDGTVLTREPYDAGDIRRTVQYSETFGQIRDARAGSFEGPSPIDGKRRIISFHRVGALPLIQDVEVSVEQAYAEWLRKALAIGSIMAFLMLCAMGLLWRLDRELTRRLAVESTLKHLASTDALTNVANRRRFDEALAHEWRRAERDRSPLSLLMIDADQFKSYNDRYGHQAGDDVLQAIAATLASNTRRPADLVARFGGEEFVVLLPNTTSMGAMVVAERIRAAVADQARPHAAASHGRVTVSIGLATAMPVLSGTGEQLLAQADAALYRAKAAGRNRCQAASAREPVPVAA